MAPSETTNRFARWLVARVMKFPGVARLVRAHMLDEGGAAFRALALSSECAPLKALLFEDDHRLLRELLALRGHAALKAILLEGDPAWFSMIVRARGGAPLSAQLFSEDAALLRLVCRLGNTEVLGRMLGTLEVPDRVRLVRALLFARRPEPLELLLRVEGMLDHVLTAPRLRTLVELGEAWDGVRPLLPADEGELKVRLLNSMERASESGQVPHVILDTITEGDTLRLAHGTLRFPCRHSLWTLLHEILINEDYYFASDREQPRIIDGGAHMGLGIYYFKACYPQAQITAFEPHPGLFALASENVARNGWDGVEVLPVALAAERGTATFYSSDTWSMAGSLVARREGLGDAVSRVSVECVPLSDYLVDPVDFLKLDIEGAECEVLEEAAPGLPNVGQLFCELHLGGGLDSGRLDRILAVLERADFEVQVAKSRSFGGRSRWRPLTHFDGAASMVLWARNRRRYS